MPGVGAVSLHWRVRGCAHVVWEGAAKGWDGPTPHSADRAIRAPGSLEKLHSRVCVGWWGVGGSGLCVGVSGARASLRPPGNTRQP